MDIESLRTVCLSFPHVAEDVQWEDSLLFRVGGKIFVIASLRPAAATKFSFKCTPETRAKLTERDGIIPAPYLARYDWVAVEGYDVLAKRELHLQLKTSYDLVFAKLPKKMRDNLLSKSQ